MTDRIFGLRLTTITGVASCLLVLALVSGVDLGHDLHRQRAMWRIQYQKREFALLGQVEFSQAVQDFKDCLLRQQRLYCDDFYDHIQAVDRDVSLYRAQSTEDAEEHRTLEALKQALAAYESALGQMRDLQGRRATIEEIDRVVKGADRPAAKELRLLANAAGGGAVTSLPLRPTLLFLISGILGAVFLCLGFAAALALGKRSSKQRPLPSQPLARMIAWEENTNDELSSRLREDVCESLLAVRYFLESMQAAAARGFTKELPATVVPSLHAAIRQTGEIAQRLQPAWLRSSGVLATLRTLWTDAQKLNPALQIEAGVEVDERDLPESLAPIILRLARMVAQIGERKLPVSRISWRLRRDANELRLAIELSLDDQPLIHASALGQVDAIRACAMLSGATLEPARNHGRHTAITATWRLDDLTPLQAQPAAHRP